MRVAAVLTAALGLCIGVPSAAHAKDDLVERYRPVVRYDSRENGFAQALDDRRRPIGADRVYGHRIRDGGRTWLQYWLFFAYNSQDRGLLRTGRHEGDWEFAQLRLGRNARPDLLVVAQHSWAERCGRFEVRGEAPVLYVANASHAVYPRRGTTDRPWPDPNDEADGLGRQVRPPVTVVSAGAPPWMAYRGRWGASRAGPWPGEESSPRGPRFQEDRRFSRPAAYAAKAEVCGSTPPGAPWPAPAAALGVMLAIVAGGWAWRRRRPT
ncbi:MAG TPA: hypothetical protein VK304_00825 [Thermoleophilaceae bacterium]|nr:hypothetical protein [Thermoleophilaceae bacterium]